jgi:transcription initiation factor IIE alpha subunit
MEDARAEVDTALRVAQLIEHEFTPAQIAERLGLELDEVRAAIRRVERARARAELSAPERS